MVLDLSNCSSGGYLIDHAFKLKIVNVQKLTEVHVPRRRIKLKAYIMPKLHRTIFQSAIFP